MKRRGILIFGTCLLLSLLACSGKETPQGDGAEITGDSTKVEYGKEIENEKGETKEPEKQVQATPTEACVEPIAGEEWTEADLEGTWYELKYQTDGRPIYSWYSPVPTAYPEYQDYFGSIVVQGGIAEFTWEKSGKETVKTHCSEMSMRREEGELDRQCENKAWYVVLDTRETGHELFATVEDADHLFLLEKLDGGTIRHYFGRAEQVTVAAERKRAPSDALVLWKKEDQTNTWIALRDDMETDWEKQPSGGRLKVHVPDENGKITEYELFISEEEINGRAEKSYLTFADFLYNDEASEEPMIGQNPIITSIYTADPAPLVVGDTLYLYTSHDEDQLINDFYTMLNWHCYSTKDMVHWTDHGQVFSLDDISWADDRAWAPQAVERNGKFYLYCPVHKRNGGMAIAVGVSDSPTGPFIDLGYPLVNEGDWNDIDPTVLIDEDGQAYLYFGNPELRYVYLRESMITYDRTIGVVKVPMTEEAFDKGGHMSGTTYAEGPWIYKRNGIYYMFYAAFGEGKGSEHLAYSTSTSPTGPWKYGGILMTEEGGTYTNHPGIVDFKGHSYLFYHTSDLPGGNLFHRSVCVAEFTFNEDGSINPVAKAKGVEAVK